MRGFTKVAAVLVVLVILAILTGCASSGQVNGVVKDQSGVAIKGATVYLNDLQTTTDTNGKFVFSNVKSGDYVLKVEAEGATPYQENIKVLGSGISKEVTLRFNSLARVKRAGVIVFGSDTTYAPFEWIDPKTGNAMGFDVDLANLLASKIGVKAQIVTADFSGIIPALQTGKFDAIISAMTITDERKKEVDFSDPYYNSGQILAVQSSNNSITKPEDLVGKTVGVQTGTTGEEAAKKINGAIVKSYPDIQLALSDLEIGRIDAVINDLPVSLYYAKTHPKVKIVGSLFTTEQYGIAFRKDEPELRDAINNALKEIKANGEYTTLYKKWFGTAPQSIP
ncbi:transporter substrate-binding domain-containing protein [Caldisericum exile]|uniref:transporter substrate-binding domain-containing protein n=1 Tax=Caldisericum exile TaxID=693075 RepID=UPI003C7339D7